MNFPKVAESRKLSGLLIGIVAELGNAVIGSVLHFVMGAPIELFLTTSGTIASLVGFHQAAQGASDRAKWQSTPGAGSSAEPPEGKLPPV